LANIGGINMDKWLEILLYSVFLAIVINILSSIIFEFFGTNIKKKIINFKRKISKWIKNDDYQITIVLKSVGLKRYKLTQNTLFKRIEELGKTKSVTFSKAKGTIIFEFKKGLSSIKCEFLPDYELRNDEKIKTSELQINITTKLAYRKFQKQFVDIYSAVDEIKKMLLSRWKLNFNILTSLSISQDILFPDFKKAKITNLNIKIKNIEIRIWKNTVDLYGEINSQIINKIKDIITLYY